MKLITRQSLVRDVLVRWNDQYKEPNANQAGIRDRLATLLEYDTATPDEVDAIIGNFTWTRTVCDGCGAINRTVIQLGEEPDYESSTATICVPCLGAAVALATAVSQ